MEAFPLHQIAVDKLLVYINRSLTFIHSTVLICMIVYRVSSFLFNKDSQAIPLIPWLLIFSSELLLGFIWLMKSAYNWRPVSRSVFLERLPPDDDLPPIDVFICTADPVREPPLKVMNTVLSSMALDYPPGKLSVYLSDDAGSSLTLYAIHEAWDFGRLWVPFCRKYAIKNGCPEAYFSTTIDDHGNKIGFQEEGKNIEVEYEKFKERLRIAGESIGAKSSQDHPAMIEIIGSKDPVIEDSDDAKMPRVVYVSREKRPSHPHNFKAGSLNVLLRVSGIISNSPYILVLDCDMYCNDSTSARQAMCFHLDQKMCSSLAFVQFPQKFGNISKNDIYDAALRYIFVVMWPGMDGLRGPILSGTCFYIKREALYGRSREKDLDLVQLKQSFGPSNEFLRSLKTKRTSHSDNKVVDDQDSGTALLQETRFVGSPTYEANTAWGFLYDSVVEDYFTGFILHCRGWSSVFCNPQRPAFLGSSPTNLSDTLIQGTRWNTGLLEVFLSRFCPIIYGLGRVPLLDCMCYAYFSAQPLYCFPVWCLAIVPQLCLLNGIPVYPRVSSPWFIPYSVAFLSTLGIHLWDVLRTGGTTRIWWNEWRVWMIKSVTAYFYGSLDALLKLFGVKEASFVPTNKVADGEQVKRYQLGIYDFQASTMLLAPLVTLVILNMVSFIWGIGKSTLAGGWGELFGQIFLSFFILNVNYPIIEGMMLRKDKGRIPPSATLFSLACSFLILLFGYTAFFYRS
ncbi:unnamed protein product [Coffea canephora]|uniref:Cellulose synthase-like protein G2 n=1 Tax=Coffea canephora TaxID=49390 RepID=A0A068TSK2_COFCA|nr:unnamed protein product [Coffea canephora]